MSASLPIEVLSKFKGDFEVFFETGTSEGDSTQTALEAGFKTVYTVEYDKPTYQRAFKRFETNLDVHVYHSNSVEALTAVLPYIESPILFFLDAHPDCHAGLTPVLQELDAIKGHKFPVRILIDDMRLMGKGTWIDISIARIIAKIDEIDPKLSIEFVQNGHKEDDLLAAY